MSQSKTNFFAAAFLFVSVGFFSGCSGNSTSELDASPQATPTTTPLFVDSSKWDCDAKDDYGICNVATYNGASTPQEENGATDFAMFQFICMANSEPSQVYVLAGSNLSDPYDSEYTWNPKTHPVFEFSLDQSARKSMGYDITAANGKIIPSGIDLLDEWPGVMRDIAGAKTLQIWINDSTGTEREIAFNVEGSVSAVANLAAWGYNCKF
jgi:hypothetical protein